MRLFSKLFALTAALVAAVGVAGAQPTLKEEALGLLNLDMPELAEVKALHAEGRVEEAAEALLAYYKARTHITTPDIPNPATVRISANEQKWADEALDHTFFVHYGYQPSFNYGEDIDWRYWPVKDNELRWQLHRHKWFTPMGKAYRTSGDEKYAEEWTKQYIDWIRKNPLVKISKEEYEINEESTAKADAENARFAWRPLEVSHRLEDQTLQFQLFICSPSFTAEFLSEFLVNYHRHAEHIMENYSAKGNHLLFQAQRMLYAGTFFPEFKRAEVWRESGVEILNREVAVQVFDDGGHFELCPHYHLATINIFYEALQVATLNGFKSAFPQSYVDALEKMIEFYANICFPDYENPCFSDAKVAHKQEVIKNYRAWLDVFGENDFVRYMATDGKEGALPAYNSKGHLTAGFFTFRSGWGQDAVQMVVKAGPKGEWHCQPDNGTFELWYNGHRLMSDSGSYIYAGDAEVMKWRNWFRQTAVHNTLTLNGENLQTTESKTLLWQPEGEVQVLVTENPSYEGLIHRRTVFFVEESWFVIVDEAVGNAEGVVNLNYQMPVGEVSIDGNKMRCATLNDFESNLTLQCFAPRGATTTEAQGWFSDKYKSKVEHKRVSFDVAKKASDKAVRYITVIVPHKEADKGPKISAQFVGREYSPDGVAVKVKVDGKS
ncbi:MAG: heparinase II/III family protein, partial [Tidjanibacter sp.]|nr:heparinase II/III family protein [Tidjanibacter sp.]